MAGSRRYPSLDDVKERVIAAICTLYRHDQELLDVDASERSITHKLAEYLQRAFPKWNVDCEYNRRGTEPKRLQFDSWAVRADDTEAKTVFPDIIVHQRLTEHNLIVVEVKKANGQADTKDVEKLLAFTETQGYQYEYGLLLRLDATGPSRLELYQQGCRQDDWTGDVHLALLELGYGG